MEEAPETNRRAKTLLARHTQLQAKLDFKRLERLREEHGSCKAVPTINKASSALAAALNKAIEDVPCQNNSQIAQLLKQQLQGGQEDSDCLEQPSSAGPETSSTSLSVTVSLGLKKPIETQLKVRPMRSPDLLETSTGLSYSSIKQLMHNNLSSLTKASDSKEDKHLSGNCSSFASMTRLCKSRKSTMKYVPLSPSVKYIGYPAGCSLAEFSKKAKPLVNYKCIARMM